MKRSLSLTLLSFFVCFASWAASVDTVLIQSQAMSRSANCVVIKPASYKKKSSRTFPVLYLLHGYSGAYNNWIKRVAELKDLADRENMLIVCPDGGYSGWYWDSPMDSTFRYETYIAKEVPAYIDQHYRTITDRTGRAITGLSMGGHGGIYLGFRHAETFGACGSMSGAVDLALSINKYDIAKRIGDTVRFAERWYSYSALAAVDQKPAQPLSILFDCGLEDHLLKGNRNLHEKMIKLGIPHDYTERPGKHDWNYWRNAVNYQVLFFSRFFQQGAKEKLNQ